MPGAKSIFKILLIIVIVFLYFFGPGLLSPTSGLINNPALITKLKIADDKYTLDLKKQGNRWVYATEDGIVPDQALVTSLLWHLSTATLTPSTQPFNPTGVSIKLTSSSGNVKAIKLGQRLKPFAQQLINVDGQVFAVNKDINACLGIWKSANDFNLKNQVTSSEVYNLQPDTISQISYSTPVANYEFTKSGSNWQLSNMPGHKVNQQHFKTTLKKLCWLSALSTPISQKEKRLQKNISLQLKTSNNEIYRFKFSKPQGEGLTQYVAVTMDKPFKRSFLTSASSFYRLKPNIPSIVSSMPRLEFKQDIAQLVKVEKKSSSFTLKRNGSKWIISSPRSNKRVAMIPGETGKNEPSTNIYVQSLASIRSDNIYQKNNKRVNKFRKKTLATITVKLKNGKQLKYKLSPKIPGTSSCLLSSGKTVLIISDYYISTLAPNVSHFYKKGRM
jgi:hypothetical protein